MDAAEPTLTCNRYANDLLVASVVAFLASIIAIFEAVALCYHHKKMSKQHKIRDRRLSELKVTVESLRRKLSDNQQTTVNTVMEDAAALLEPYRVPFNHVAFVEPIGRGGSAEVWTCKIRGGTFAVKRLLPLKDGLNEARLFKKECQLMALIQKEGGISHPNLVHMILEYHERGSLHDLLHEAVVKRTQKNKCWISWRETLLKVALDTASGLKFLHGLTPAVVHRDVKSANILVATSSGSSNNTSLPKGISGASGFRAIVSDFGTSKELETEETHTVVGTRYFVAPEVLMQEHYTTAVDVYSLGILFYEMAIAQHNNVLRDMFGRGVSAVSIIKGWRPEFPGALKSQMPMLVSLITECWASNFRHRPSMTTVVGRLQRDVRQDTLLFGNQQGQKNVPTKKWVLGSTFRRRDVATFNLFDSLVKSRGNVSRVLPFGNHSISRFRSAKLSSSPFDDGMSGKHPFHTATAGETTPEITPKMFETVASKLADVDETIPSGGFSGRSYQCYSNTTSSSSITLSSETSSQSKPNKPSAKSEIAEPTIPGCIISISTTK